MNADDPKTLLQVAQDVRKEHEDKLDKARAEAKVAVSASDPSEKVQEALPDDDNADDNANGHRPCEM